MSGRFTSVGTALAEVILLVLVVDSVVNRAFCQLGAGDFRDYVRFS